MLLNSEQLEEVARIIASHVSAEALGQIAFELLENEPEERPLDIEFLLKTAPSEPEERRRAVASSIVQHFNGSDRCAFLFDSLLRTMRRNDALCAELAAFLPRVSVNADKAKQAQLAARATTLLSRRLRDFLAEIEPQVCIIVSQVSDEYNVCSYVTGTGFLVGPDLVLTAYHNVKKHVTLQVDRRVGTPNDPEILWAYFDFLEGPQVAYPRLPEGTKIPFHREWLVHSSPDLPFDGQLSDDEQLTQKDDIEQKLDFALIRLASRAGQQTSAVAGGSRRGWVDVSSWTADLGRDQKVVISQHPLGQPQQIDFGKYSVDYTASDKSRTRLRYSTETYGGTSGAPCFTEIETRFSAVGMHNATFIPGLDGVAQANQAIDIRRIRAQVLPHLSAETTDAATKFRNLSGDRDKPRLLFGRDIFLDWIERACQVPEKRADRVYAAIGDTPNCGRSFSIEILNAARRRKGEPLVVLGKQGESVPASAMDFIDLVADQLAIGRKSLEGRPPRPSSDLPGGKDKDKLRKWASDEVPRWFHDVLVRRRSANVDSRTKAIEAVRALREMGVEPPLMLLDLASAPTAEASESWERAWIAIDGMSDVDLSPEVADLVSGLLGGNLAEASTPPELRRLRWLFLGRPPGFVDQDDVTPEPLDPLQIGADQFVATFDQYFDSIQRPWDARSARTVFEMFDGSPHLTELHDEKQRLIILQSLTPLGVKSLQRRSA